MKITDTPIAGVRTVESGSYQDHRGAFSRLFCAEEERAILGDRQIVQINHSLTHAVGAVRGIHYQRPPQAEIKIVRCLRGRVLDVAVDLRMSSPTFLKWTAAELSPSNRLAFVIPEGCGHGFQVLEENSELLYMHTAFYTPALEGGVRFDDPAVGIDWPLPPVDQSPRDLNHPAIDAAFEGIHL